MEVREYFQECTTWEREVNWRPSPKYLTTDQFDNSELIGKYFCP